MKNAPDKAVVDQVKSVKDRARLAKVVVAKPAYSKAARQAAFNKAFSSMPVVKAVSRAKLIAKVVPGEFRIIRMPG